MTTLAPAALIAALHWRYATKQFDPSRSIPAETWAALEQSLVLAPSSFGLQPWRFLVVDDPGLRTQLRAASWNQAQVVDAARLVVFLGRRSLNAADADRLIARTAEVRGAPVEALKGYRDLMAGHIASLGPERSGEWNARQVYIALGQFMAAAALLGVDTCPLEGLDPAAYDRILGVEGGEYRTLVACVAGYRAAGDKYAAAAKVRYPADGLLIHR